MLTDWSRDYDVHGPVGPTAFWKATDAEDPRGSLLNGMSGMPLAPGWPQALLENAPASEEEMMFIGSSDDDDDWDADLDPIDDELPGLLQDAEMDLVDVAPQGAQGAH